MSNRDLALRYELYIAAPPDTVWRALTDGAQTERYFYGTRVTGELSPGARLRYLGPDGAEVLRADIEAVSPGRRLVTTCEARWDDAVGADPPSRLEWELTPMGAATRLVLIHDTFSGSTATHAQCAAGWPVVLSGLKTLVETGRALVVGS